MAQQSACCGSDHRVRWQVLLHAENVEARGLVANEATGITVGTKARPNGDIWITSFSGWCCSKFIGSHRPSSHQPACESPSFLIDSFFYFDFRPRRKAPVFNIEYAPSCMKTPSSTPELVFFACPLFKTRSALCSSLCPPLRYVRF